MKAKLHTADRILFTVLENKFKVKTKAMEFKDDVARINHNVISYKLFRDEAKKITDVCLVPESIKINCFSIKYTMEQIFDHSLYFNYFYHTSFYIYIQ